MKKLLLLLALIAIPFSAHAQTPGAQPEFCLTSPSQTANYNQICISASAAGGAIQVANFGTATGGFNIGTITGGTWNGNPITNPFIANPFTTVNGVVCTLGATCTISSPVASVIVGSTSITGGTTNQILYDNAGTLGEITKGNSCLYGTNGTGVPSCLTTLPANLSASSLTAPSLAATNMTVTGSFTATGLVTNADLVNTVITVNTVPCTLGSTCTIAAAAALVVGSTSVTSGTTNQLLYDNGGTLGEITKGNSCVYGTNGTGVPSCLTTVPGSWGGNPIDISRGGTSAALTASTGGIIYSGASAFAVLAGTATASLPLLSGSSAAPTWATIAYPTSANSGGIPYFSSSSVMASSSAFGQNCAVYGGGIGAAPATSSSTCPTISAAGLVNIQNTTASTTIANGALVVGGGLGLAGDVHSGGSFFGIAMALTAASTLTSTTQFVGIVIQNGVNQSAAIQCIAAGCDNGALVLSNGGGTPKIELIAGSPSYIGGGTLTLGSTSTITGNTGELGFAKIGASGSAPGAGFVKIAAVAGTNAGSCKIIAYAGTSTTPVTILDNIGSGC